MMYLLLILFFASLASIIVMIGRKLAKLEYGQVLHHKEVAFELPYIKEIKNITIANIKKYEHVVLINIVRLYVRSATFLKSKYEEIKTKIKNIRKTEHIKTEKKEISKFLKMIADYKHKVREIKHKINKEENL